MDRALLQRDSQTAADNDLPGQSIVGEPSVGSAELSASAASDAPEGTEDE